MRRFLNKGLVIAQKEEATLEKMVPLMVGRDFDQKAHREFIKDYTDREVVLEVKNLTVSNRVKNASFKLYKGEVLGLTGLVGAGRSVDHSLILRAARSTCTM